MTQRIIITSLFFLFTHLLGVAQIKTIKIKKHKTESEVKNKTSKIVKKYPEINQLIFSTDPINFQKIDYNQWLNLYDNIFLYTRPFFRLNFEITHFIDNQPIKANTYLEENLLYMTHEIEKNSKLFLKISLDADTFLFKGVKLTHINLALPYEFDETHKKIRIQDSEPQLYFKQGSAISLPFKRINTEHLKKIYEVSLMELDENTIYKIHKIQVTQVRGRSIFATKIFTSHKLSFRFFTPQAGDEFYVTLLNADRLDNNGNVLEKNVEIQHKELQFIVTPPNTHNLLDGR